MLTALGGSASKAADAARRQIKAAARFNKAVGHGEIRLGCQCMEPTGRDDTWLQSGSNPRMCVGLRAARESERKCPASPNLEEPEALVGLLLAVVLVLGCTFGLVIAVTFVVKILVQHLGLVP